MVNREVSVTKRTIVANSELTVNVFPESGLGLAHKRIRPYSAHRT